MGTPEQLQTLVETSVIKALTKSLKNQSTTDKKYYTRKELASLFSCSLGTIHNWTKSGRLQAYGQGSRVFYKVEEVHASLTPKL